ncbi:MAG: hypothetical protein HYV35_10695 [Lentisphaerae bacterium]|nr:hypothetical protein [Lentisphaerota bacterium]
MKRFIVSSIAACFALASLSVYAEAEKAAVEAAPAKAEAKAELKEMTCTGKLTSKVKKVGDKEVTQYAVACKAGAVCPMGNKCVLPDVKIEGVDLSKLVGKNVELTCTMDGKKIVEVKAIKEAAAAKAEHPEHPSK